MKLPIKQVAFAIGALLLVTILAYAWQKTGNHAHDKVDEHHGQKSVSETEKGIHGGRLFRADNYAYMPLIIIKSSRQEMCKRKCLSPV